MELDLILGDAPKPFGYLEESNTQKQQQQKKKKTSGLDFCMALGLGSYGAAGDHEEEKGKPQKSEEQEDGRDDDNKKETPVQLNLLPLQAPLPPWISSHLQSFPCSSDNGPSEGSSVNGSSGNIGPPAPAKIPLGAATAEEAPSANSPFQTDFGTRTDTAGNGNLLVTSGGRRDFEATGNDVAEGERTSPRASEDDENGLSARKKIRLSKLQSDFLEERFKEHSTLNPKQKLDLAKQLNLRIRQVEVWFQNRRARSKMKQTEMEFEYWKRCCEALTEDNRRLHKELQELRSVVQASRPYSAQFPAATLTTCPSCENAATSLPATAS